MMRTCSNSTKRIMRIVFPKSTTATAAKSSPQSGRERFETAAIVVDPDADSDSDVDGDDGDLTQDDLSVSI